MSIYYIITRDTNVCVVLIAFGLQYFNYVSAFRLFGEAVVDAIWRPVCDHLRL